MAFDTIIQQGRFTSDGTAETLSLRSDIDWIRIYNETAIAQNAADLGAEFYFQRGMTSGRGLFYKKLGAVANDPVTVGQIAANSGFTLVDTSVEVFTVAPGPITNITAGPPPRITSAAHGFQTGDIVRIVNAVGAFQLGATDWSITRVDANNFDLTHMPLAIVAAAAPGATSQVIRVANAGTYIPTVRTITNINIAGANVTAPIVTFSAPHSFTAGQRVRFKVPRVTAAAFGMTQFDGLEATITAVSVANNTITVDIDATGFTTFAYPLSANISFSPATVVPVGEDTADIIANNRAQLLGATQNDEILGVILAAGADSPAGQLGDVIYWVAGKSFSVENE